MPDPEPSRRSANAVIANAVIAGALTATALVLAACAAPQTGPDADRRFYEGRCGNCHVPFHPSNFPARKWPAIVDVMGPRAGLTKAQRERILGYLTAPEPVAAEAGGGPK